MPPVKAQAFFAWNIIMLIKENISILMELREGKTKREEKKKEEGEAAFIRSPVYFTELSGDLLISNITCKISFATQTYITLRDV